MSTQKMKTKAVGAMVLTFLLFLGSYSTANAQSGVLDRLEQKVEKKVERRVERKVDRGIDNTLDKAEDKVDGNKGSKKNDKSADNKNSGSNGQTNGNANNGTSNTQTGNSQPAVVVTNNNPKPKSVNMLTVNTNVAKASSMDAEWVNTEVTNYSMMSNMGSPGPSTSTNTGASTTTKTTPANTGTGNNSGAATDGGTNNANNANNANATSSGNNTQSSNTAGSGSSPDAKEGQPTQTQSNANAGNQANANAGNQGTRLNINSNANWDKYDFTPGELVIFADNEAKAQDGEFPNDFRLLKGSAEYSDLGNEKAISFLGIPTEIAPKMKTEAFLPQVFTVEFDAYFHNIENESYVLRFKGMQDIEARLNSVAMGDFNGYTTDNLQQAAWRHIAVVFNPQGMKMYVDQFRVVNIPKVDVKPSSFTIFANNDGAKTGNRAMIRNFRLYDASVVPVDRFKADGKLVTHGITFASGSADLNPESAGTLNLVADMLSEDPDLKMSIEVHSEKTAASSSDLQILTDKRAAAIKSALVARGVDGSRLTAKGMGDFKPIDSNDSASGRQNNRRVEFVKM